MDPVTIIAAIESVIKVATAAVQLEQDIQPYAVAIYNAFIGNKLITQADLDALAAQSDALSAELQLPLPPDPAQA